ncbi:MAG: YesL family protein [Firmicutes bacterium]|nr:YesL family protein [Bacillota bacterium]
MTIKDVFGADGPFARFGTLLFDIIYVDFLWLVLGGPMLIFFARMLPVEGSGFLLFIVWMLIFIGVLHAGPGTTAAYAAMGKRMRGEDSYIFKDFWKSYRQNYKQGLIVSLIVLIVGAVLGEAMWMVLEYMELIGGMFYIVFPVQCFVAAEIVMTTSYAFPLLARFDMKTGELLKNAALMANKHLPTSLLNAAILAGCLYVVFFLNIGAAILMFGVYFALSSLTLERVFRQYMEPEDVLSPEEVEALGQTKVQLEEPSAKEKAARDKERQEIIDKYTRKINKN